MAEEKQTQKLHTGKKTRKIKLLTITCCALTIAFVCAVAVMFYAISVITSVKSDNETLKVQVEDGITSIESIKADLNSVKNENSTLSAQYNELIAQYEIESKRAAELQAELDAISTETGSKEELAARASSLTKQLDILRSTNTELTKQIIALQQKLTELSSESSEEQTASYNEDGKFAFLTFDDGVSKYTNDILDILKEYGVKATFFPNWRSGTENAEKYKRIVNEGHTLGNHSNSHDWDTLYKVLDGQTASERAEYLFLEMQKLQTKIFNTTGYLPTFFRFPGGSGATIRNAEDVIPAAIPMVTSAGMIYCDWNVDSGDASTSTALPSDKIVSNIMNRVYKSDGTLRSPAIILMHDTATKRTTVGALPQIIEGLIAKGYTILPLSADVPVVQSRKAV